MRLHWLQRLNMKCSRMLDERPVAVDLFSGLGGWTEGLTAAGWYVIRFDLEDMCALLGEPHPEHSSLVIQDVLTLHGAQFKDVGLIVSSSPCQEFSYRAMPWKRAKALGPPELGMKLFHAQFRIQQEACEAAGRYIPLVVENVRGAQPWVGRARWNFGSYYLWGDLPALMPPISKAHKVPGFRFDGNGGSFQTAAVNEHMKNQGGSWFNIGSPGQKETNRNPVHRPDEHLKLKDQDGYERDHPQAFGWKKPRTSSKSHARKAASAKIAKIPFTLSHWIGRAWFPRSEEEAA